MNTAHFAIVGALGTATVILLTACSTDGASAPTSSATTPSATATTARTSLDTGSQPDLSAYPACSAVLPSDLVHTLAPHATTSVPAVGAAHSDATETLTAMALGLHCAVTNGVAEIDDVKPGSSPTEIGEHVSVTVLPDAKSALTRYQDSTKQTGGDDATAAQCDATDAARVQCEADTLVGSAWVSISVERLQDSADATPEAILPTFHKLVSSVESTIRGNSIATRTVSGSDSSSTSGTICTADRVNAASSTHLQNSTVGDSSAGISLRAAITARANGSWCEFDSQTGDDARPYMTAGAFYTSIPKAGWAAQQRADAGLGSTKDLLKLAGLGSRDAAWRTCDEMECSVDIVHNGDWTRYVLDKRVAPNTSDAIEKWMRSSWGR